MLNSITTNREETRARSQPPPHKQGLLVSPPSPRHCIWSTILCLLYATWIGLALLQLFMAHKLLFCQLQCKALCVGMMDEMGYVLLND